MADITLSRLNVTFPRAVGIDYLSPAQSLVLSVNYSGGSPHVFETLDAAGNQAVFAAGAIGYQDEVKVATVPAGNPQFPEGDVFAGNGAAGQIVRITAGGSTVINPWVTLAPEDGLLRGSLYVDRTGLFGYDLIVVTTTGGVWRVNASGQKTKLATITDGGVPVHLEGVVTLPNDPAKYGPLWAGKILTGAEDLGRFYHIAANGASDWNSIVADDGMTVAPEDIDAIATNQNLFAIEYGDTDGPDYRAGAILTAGAAQFSGMAGDLLVSVEWGNAKQGVIGALYRVRWDGSSYVANWLAAPDLGTHFEHATFAPITVTPPPPQVSLTAQEPLELYEDPGTSGDLTFSRTGDWAVPLTVKFTLPGGTGRATFLEDYGLYPALTPDANGDFWFTIPAYYGGYPLRVIARPDSFLEGPEVVRAELQAQPTYTIDPLAVAAELTLLDEEDNQPKPYFYNLIAITPTWGDYYQNWSEAYAINNYNSATGFFNPPPNYSQWTPHAFRWVEGAPLADLNPPSIPDAWTWGYGINEWGWIVGKYQPPGGGDFACLWDDQGNLSTYPPFEAGSFFNQANAINSGTVVGSGMNGSGVVQAIRWSDGTRLTSLSNADPFGKVSYAYAVNSDGRVIGKSRGDFSTTVFHAFRTLPQPPQIQPADDLGTGTADDLDTSEALGINDLGEAVGATHFNTAGGKYYHAFFKTVYQNKNLGFRDLTPAKYWSRATAISNPGHVVGSYQATVGSPTKGFVQFNDGTFGDLWDLTNPDQSGGWEFTSPLAINDRGWIVGWGYFNGAYARGFILVPAY